MIVKCVTAAALFSALLSAAPAAAQTAPAAPAEPVVATTAADWRAVAPENLLVIDTAKGRILVELEPRVAPQSVARIRALADQGFYDGLKFHRVISGFMAQTGDPLGTGEGGSELANVPAEFTFRRGRDGGFGQVANGPLGILGIYGSLPIMTQPDAQMMVTADFKAAGQGLFCPGVAGMARNTDPDSANSQFFLMMAENDALNGQYTAFGRVVAGLDVVKALKTGPESRNGQVDNPDVMTRVRTAAALPEGQRPAVRVLLPASAAFVAMVARQRELARDHRLNVCDVQPPVDVAGG